MSLYLRGCIQLAQAVDDGFALECEVQPRLVGSKVHGMKREGCG